MFAEESELKIDVSVEAVAALVELGGDVELDGVVELEGDVGLDGVVELDGKVAFTGIVGPIMLGANTF